MLIDLSFCFANQIALIRAKHDRHSSNWYISEFLGLLSFHMYAHIHIDVTCICLVTKSAFMWVEQTTIAHLAPTVSEGGIVNTN